MFAVDDAPRTDWPNGINSGQVMKVIEGNNYLATREIADIVPIFK